jgi:hypothetical protein
MSTTEPQIDGAAIAELLAALFGGNLAAARRVCQSCREEHPIGDHAVHDGAGYVVRCPGCGDVATTVIEVRDRFAIDLRGSWRLAR